MTTGRAGFLSLLLTTLIGGPIVSGCGGATVVERQDPGVVALEGATSNAFVPAGESGEMVARIRVTTNPLQGHSRPPINLALVIDTSGSMEGEPIEDAREASLALLETLAEGDRLAVVAFHSTTEVLLPSTELDDDNLEELRAEIGRMEAIGTTDMAGGVAAGMQELVANFQPDGINRMVLLGDGVPNDEEGIAALAQAAGERGIAVTALGLGLDYNETLMGQIAQLSGGQFHYIEESAQVATVFRDEVLRMQRVMGRNAIVTLQPGPGVTIDSVIGQNVSATAGAVRVVLGDLTEGEHRDVLVRATVDGHRDGARVEVMDVHLTFDDALADAGGLERRVFLGARATGDAEEIARHRNVEIERAAERVQAAAVTIEAIRVARAGELERARELLRQAENRVQTAATTFEDEELADQASRIRSLSQALPVEAGAADAESDDGEEPAPSVAPAQGAPPPENRRRILEAHEEAMDFLGY